MKVAIRNTEPQYRNKIHPKIFALYAACASITMMFMAWSSAYIVRQAAGNWLEFALPQMFYISTVIILASSITLHGSYLSFKKGNAAMYRGLMVLTLLLGLGFVAAQYQGWQDLKAIGIELAGNPSGSFVYVISGMHALHVLGGIAALVVALLHAFMLKYKVTPGRLVRFELTLTYWHFVDILWVYLLIFFIIQQA